MTTPFDTFVLGCELHDPNKVASAFRQGLHPTARVDGQSPLDWLLRMYTRSDRFPDCVRALLAFGVPVEPAALRAVLLDDADGVAAACASDAAAVHARVMLPSAFTPLDDATLLHVAAEHGHLRAVRALLAAGIDPNVRAGLDADGLGGQTPIFHTVNAHANRSAPLMHALLAAGADPLVRVDGLTWGRGLEWESTFFDLTPVSYAQLGTLPQMHRGARDIDANVRALLTAAGRPVPAMTNVPNRYLADRR